MTAGNLIISLTFIAFKLINQVQHSNIFQLAIKLLQYSIATEKTAGLNWGSLSDSLSASIKGVIRVQNTLIGINWKVQIVLNLSSRPQISPDFVSQPGSQLLILHLQLELKLIILQYQLLGLPLSHFLVSLEDLFDLDRQIKLGPYQGLLPTSFVHLITPPQGRPWPPRQGIYSGVPSHVPSHQNKCHNKKTNFIQTL